MIQQRRCVDPFSQVFGNASHQGNLVPIDRGKQHDPALQPPFDLIDRFWQRFGRGTFDLLDHNGDSVDLVRVLIRTAAPTRELHVERAHLFLETAVLIQQLTDPLIQTVNVGLEQRGATGQSILQTLDVRERTPVGVDAARALRVWGRAGFVRVERFVRPRDQRPFLVLVRD